MSIYNKKIQALYKNISRHTNTNTTNLNSKARHPKKAPNIKSSPSKHSPRPKAMVPELKHKNKFKMLSL